jgi:hypothetical protein
MYNFDLLGFDFIDGKCSGTIITFHATENGGDCLQNSLGRFFKVRTK